MSDPLTNKVLEAMYEWQEGWRFCDTKISELNEPWRSKVIDELGNHRISDLVISDDCACQLDLNVDGGGCQCTCHTKTKELTKLISTKLKALISDTVAKAEKSVEAVKYMISVWDEVSPSWRETPDHVQRKFIEAEAQLKPQQESEEQSDD